MTRVEGAADTINEGVIADVPQLQLDDDLYGEAFSTISAANDPAMTVIRIANAKVRGDYVGNPNVNAQEVTVLATIAGNEEAIVHENDAAATSQLAALAADEEAAPKRSKRG